MQIFLRRKSVGILCRNYMSIYIIGIELRCDSKLGGRMRRLATCSCGSTYEVVLGSSDDDERELGLPNECLQCGRKIENNRDSNEAVFYPLYIVQPYDENQKLFPAKYYDFDGRLIREPLDELHKYWKQRERGIAEVALKKRKKEIAEEDARRKKEQLERERADPRFANWYKYVK